MVWNTLPGKTFTSCFRKCRISEEAAASAIADNHDLLDLEEDDEDAVKTSETDLQFLKTNFERQVDGYLTIDDYINNDRKLCTNLSTISNKDIICKVFNHPVEVSSDEEDDDAGVVEIRKPLMEEVKSVVEMLEKFSLYSDFG